MQRFRLRLMWFSYTILHVPGKDLVTADTLSRAPAVSTSIDEQEFQEDVEAFVTQIVSQLPASEERLQQINPLPTIRNS